MANVKQTPKKISRRKFLASAGALGVMGLAGCAQEELSATGDDSSTASAADEWHGVADSMTSEMTVDVPGIPPQDGVFRNTFNGGPLTWEEQHASLSTFDYRTNALSMAQIVEDAKAISDEEAKAILFNEPVITTDYVQADGKVIPAVYIALRNRLNHIGMGVGSELVDGTWDFLMNEFTPEQAQFYLDVPNLAYFTAEEAAVASGKTVEEAEELCMNLSSRGLLNRGSRNGEVKFHTLTFAHGMLEFTMDRYEEEGYLPALMTLLGPDGNYQLRNSGSPFYYPIPAQADIVGDSKILPCNDWQEIIETHDVISVSPCQCRSFTPLMAGMKPGDLCDHPMETCISTGEQAQYYIENGIGRQIDKAEAREIIQRGVDAGMVIQVMNTEECDVICQCHGDCCGILGNYIALEGDVDCLAQISNYELQVDHDRCIQCGSCAARCPMFTIEMTDDGPQIGNLCIRCGQCATVCPVEARKLFALPEDKRPTLPKDMVEDYYIKALERAKRGMIQDFDPATDTF